MWGTSEDGLSLLHLSSPRSQSLSCSMGRLKKKYTLCLGALCGASREWRHGRDQQKGMHGSCRKQKVEIKRCKERDNRLTVGTTFPQLSLGEGHCAGKRLWREILACCHPARSCLWRQEDPTMVGGTPVSQDAARMKLLGNHNQKQKPVDQCGLCQPTPLHQLFLQWLDKR